MVQTTTVTDYSTSAGSRSRRNNAQFVEVCPSYRPVGSWPGNAVCGDDRHRRGGGTAIEDPSSVPDEVAELPPPPLDFLIAEPITNGYVLTHEHPTYAMAFGGNWAWAGSLANFEHGMPKEPYGVCGGCFANLCDHAEQKGVLLGESFGVDSGDHSSSQGPFPDSFTHLRYSTRWIKDAAEPNGEHPRLQLMVAYAVESEPLCHLLRSYNVGGGGPLGDGFPCSNGDSFNSLERQIQTIKDWADSVSWAQVAYSSIEARDIIEEGKLAIVIGVEADYAFGAEGRTFDPVNRLAVYYDLGVRTVYLAHKVNSRLAGADVFRSADSADGRVIRAQQALQGCFHYDDSGLGAFPLQHNGHFFCDNDSRCGVDHIRGSGLAQNCNKNISEVSLPNLNTYLNRADGSFNGFHVYPQTAGFGHRHGITEDATGFQRNELGLSVDGRRVVEHAMELGMILTLDHVSTRARSQMRKMTRDYHGFDYPLNAFHNYPNEMLIKNLAEKYPGPSEYDFFEHERAWIKQSRGVFGLRLGPVDSTRYLPSGVTMDCPGSITESAKMIAALLDEELPVGFSLDFAAGTKALWSRWWQGCIANQTDDYLVQDHRGRVTKGIGHIGNMREFSRELAQAGMKASYLDRLYNTGTESFVRMWGRSEGYVTIAP